MHMPIRKSASLKKLSGETRQIRLKRVASESVATPRVRMPANLPADVAREWRRLAPQLLPLGLVGLDTIALRDLCTCVARLQAAEVDIDTRGQLIEGYRKSKVKNPSLQIAREYRLSVTRWCDRFGLTLKARSILVVPEPESKEPSLDELLFKGVLDEH
jgi:P27 family predicted phage terminase small subunit